ncbi:MAG TPA: DNA polymerase III subunit epsilon [Rhodanobacteraceae bacterium]|nr:DNA polymerase III subunit epsilon [Rhodanobacteraceae bacterium]
MSRLVVLDTETTGLDAARGHRIIEIGCVELIARRRTGRQWHRYLNPQRAIDAGARAVHGLGEHFLADKPLFADVVDELLAFIDGAELIIHNAAFDVGFIDAELARLGTQYGCVADRARILDTLPLARKTFPGQHNSLDALCKRLGVDNSARQSHGALLDAQLLADVYLAMTIGQGSLELAAVAAPAPVATRLDGEPAGRPRVQYADAAEAAAHQAWLDRLDRDSGSGSLWRLLDAPPVDPAPEPESEPAV